MSVTQCDLSLGLLPDESDESYEDGDTESSDDELQLLLLGLRLLFLFFFVSPLGLSLSDRESELEDELLRPVRDLSLPRDFCFGFLRGLLLLLREDDEELEDEGLRRLSFFFFVFSRDLELGDEVPDGPDFLSSLSRDLLEVVPKTRIGDSLSSSILK